MKPLDNTENKTRTQEIRIIWKQHQWLYIIIGFIIGLLFTALTQVHTTDFFLNLIPEALGISFGVFVIDRLYRHWERQRLLQLIKKEIISNLSLMTTKTKSEITPAYIWGMPIRSRYGKNDMDGITSVTGQHIKWLFIYLITGTNASQLRTDFIESALTSDTLLLLGNIDFSKETTFHEALLELRNLIDRRKNIDEKLLKQSGEYLYDLTQQVEENKTYQLSNMKILEPMACINLDINIISWSQNIIASINTGKPTVTIPKLRPIAPIDKEAKQISEETPQPSEIEEWIPNWKFNW
jgi:hypothetical protein